MAVHYQPGLVLQEHFENTFGDVKDSPVTVPQTSSPSLSIPSSATSPAIAGTISVIEQADFEEVLNFLRCFFFRDEPLNCSIGLLDSEHPKCAGLEEFCMKSVTNGICLKMRACNDGRIIGVCLNEVLEPGFIDAMDPTPVYAENPKFEQILRILTHVAIDSDVFRQFPDVTKAFSVKILSVDGDWRGRGIGKDLMDHSREIGRRIGCQLMTVDCTSNFTARALAKLQFNCVYTLNYADYKVDGKAVFKPSSPHKAITVYAQRIA